jgi:hypothetical protein
VITDQPPSVQTFALYGQRFGGIEPHFKDYKSAAFELPRSKLRDADALSRLLMLLAAATIIAISVAIEVMAQGALNSIDWHAQRGLSFLQIGLRQINQLCYQRLPLPPFRRLPRCNPPPAYASLKKQDAMNIRIESSMGDIPRCSAAKLWDCNPNPRVREQICFHTPSACGGVLDFAKVTVF